MIRSPVEGCRMKSILYRLYGQQRGDAALKRLSTVLEAFPPGPKSGEQDPFARSDTLLITYGDTLLREGEPPLQTLHRFLNEHVKGMFSGLHLLPPFPYSLDDGFSVTDFLHNILIERNQ